MRLRPPPVIATNRQVIAVRWVRHGRWAVAWSEFSAQIESPSDETAESPRLTPRTHEGERVLQCRKLRGEKARNDQGRLREALLTILDRRTAATPDG